MENICLQPFLGDSFPVQCNINRLTAVFIQCEKAVPRAPGACQVHNCTSLNTFITWNYNKRSRDTCFLFSCQQNTSNKLNSILSQNSQQYFFSLPTWRGRGIQGSLWVLLPSWPPQCHAGAPGLQGLHKDPPATGTGAYYKISPSSCSIEPRTLCLSGAWFLLELGRFYHGSFLG